MDTKVNLLASVLFFMELSREEQVSLIRRLQEMWKIPDEEFLSPSELLNGLKRVEGLCLEMKDLLLLKGQPVSETVGKKETETVPAAQQRKENRGNKEHAVAVPKQPRFSKNGKRLGRPPKNAAVQTMPAAEVHDNKEAGAETVTTEGNAVKTEDVSAENAEKAEAPPQADSKTVSSAPADDNVIRLVNAEEIEGVKALIMGKRYDFAIVYKWSAHLYVKSYYILSGMYPVGVCVNYGGKIRPDYSGFVMSLTDEVPGIPLRQAKAYAANKLPRFEGERWAIMDVVQQGIVRKVSTDLNRLLNKLSGDPFNGKYVSSHKADMLAAGVKIRYAVDFK